MQNMFSIGFKQKRLISYILLSFVVLYVIFSPAINQLYYSSDDFRYAFGGLNKTCVSDDGFEFMLTLGRPIQAYIDCASYKFAYTLERMQILRLFSLLLLATTIGLLANLFFSLRLSLVSALASAFCFFLIQYLYSPVILMGTLPLVLPILFALLANLFLNVSQQDTKKVFRLALSVILLLCALLTYPAVAFFFAVIILLKTLFSDLSDWPVIRSRVILETLTFFSACLLYFVFAYLNMHYNARALIPPSYHLDHPNFNILEITKRLASLINIFDDKWAILPSGQSPAQKIILLTLLLAGSVAGVILLCRSDFYKKEKKTALYFLLQKTAAVFCLLILSNAFLLVIPDFDFIKFEHWLLYVYIASVFSLLIWCAYQLSGLFSPHWRHAIFISFLLVFLIPASLQANIIMTARSWTAAKYINYHQRLVANYLSKSEPLKRIHFIIPSSYYPYDRYFLINAVLVQLHGRHNFDLTWCSLPRGIPGKEIDHQQDMRNCLDNLGSNGIAATYSFVGEPYQQTPDMLVIDDTKISPIEYFNDWLIKSHNIRGWSYS